MEFQERLRKLSNVVHMSKGNIKFDLLKDFLKINSDTELRDFFGSAEELTGVQLDWERQIISFDEGIEKEIDALF